MGITEYYYLATGLALSVFAAGGYGVLSVSPPHFVAARRCFWISAVLFVSIGIVWAVNTAEPFWLRSIVVAITATIGAIGLTETLRWVKGLEEAARPPIRIELPLGSLRYVTFIADVLRNISTKRTSVQMIVELRNGTDRLMYFHAQLRGNIGGKPATPELLEFDGNIPGGDTRRLMYPRIFDVPVNEKPNSDQAVISGTLDYDVKYWIDSSPQRTERRTVKRVEFDMWRPFTDRPSPGGQVKLETTVRLSSETEE